MNRQRLLKTFRELLMIDSPSRKEGKVSQYVARILRDCGFSVRRDKAGRAFGGKCGNLVGRLPATDDSLPTHIFVSHMDTVVSTSGLQIVFDGKILKSDGRTILGADDKAGVAAMCELARELSGDKIPHGPIEFLFSVAEEPGLLGLKHLDFSLLKGKTAFVLDSHAAVGSVVTSAPSAVRMTATVHGKAAHAGVEPEKGINSIAIASAAIAKMRLGRIDDETTANIGIINGGTATNIVPEKTVVKGEARSFSEKELARQVAHMEAQFALHAKKFRGRAEVKSEHDFTTFAVASEHPMVQLALAAARKIGRKTSIQKSGGGSDANVLNEHGIRSVILGMGYKGPHTEKEAIPVTSLFAATEWILEIVRQSPRFLD